MMMLIDKLTIEYFGRFHNLEMELKPGINLIYGENESGKSTIHSFIKGMLFGIERLRGRGAGTKEDIYTRYLPWDYPGAYSGTMDITLGDVSYRLYRSFHANNKDFSVLELSTGREVKLREETISSFIPGLTESAFRNTISMEQLKARTDGELARQVQNYIANLSVGKSNELNIAKALESLAGRKKELEAAISAIPIKKLQEEIAAGLEKEKQLQEKKLQQLELCRKKESLKKQLEEAARIRDGEEGSRILQLPGILEKYNSYRELSRQYQQLESRNKELQESIELRAKKQQEFDLLIAESREAGILQQKTAKLRMDHQKLKEELQELTKLNRKRGLLCGIPTLLLAAVALPVSGYKLIGYVGTSLLLLLGVVVYQLLGRRHSVRRTALIHEKNVLEKQLKEKEVNLEALLKKYSVQGAEELLTKQEEVVQNRYALDSEAKQREELLRRMEELEDQRDGIYDTIMTYLQHFFAAEDLTEETMERLKEVVHNRKTESTDQYHRINDAYDECRLNLKRLGWEIDALEETTTLLEKIKALLEEQKKQLDDLQIELDAVCLARETIKELSEAIHDSFGQQINQLVSSVIAEITGHKYSDLKVDEKLVIKAGYQGNYIPLERLSAGTIDQIYFALRVAVADLIFGDNQCPLFLDDSLALYDDARVKRTLFLLNGRKQVLLFTCHQRERRILEDLRIPYHYVDLTGR